MGKSLKKLARNLKKKRELVRLMLISIAFIGSLIYTVVQIQEKSSTIASLEFQLGMMTLDIRPGAGHITDADIMTTEDSIAVIFEDCYISVIGDTGPMLPWLAKGTGIVIENTGNVSVGDVAVYERDGGRVLQRIIGEQGDSWVLKSDREYEAVVVAKNLIVGRLIAVLY